MIELNLLSTSISGKYFNQIENLCVHFDQKYEKHIFFSLWQPKKCKYFLYFLIKFWLRSSSEHFEHWVSIRAISIIKFSIIFRSEHKSSKFFFEHFDLDLGRAGEFSSDPSQISSDPMLGLNSNSIICYFCKMLLTL